MSNLRNFGCKFEKLLPYLKSASSKFIKMQSFVQKKILKFGPKKPFLSIFKLKFEKANVSILEFAEMLKIVQRGKKRNLGPKMLYLGILGCKLEKL